MPAVENYPVIENSEFWWEFFATENTEIRQEAASVARRGTLRFPSLQAGAFDRLAFDDILFKRTKRVMHECWQLLLVFEACALMKVEREEERQVERERENKIAQVWNSFRNSQRKMDNTVQQKIMEF